MLKLKIDNEEGVVFVTVLVLVISMMILAVTVVNLQLNQATLSEKEINRVRSEAIATGALMYYIANGPPPGNALTDMLNGISFNTTITNDGGTPGPNNTNTLTITVDY